MKNLIARHPLSAFFVLAVLINLLANALRLLDPDIGTKVFQTMQREQMKGDMISGIQLTFEFPLAWTFFLSPAAPTIAAFIVISIVWGVSGLKSWADRFKLWRKVGWQQGLAVWALSFLGFFALLFIFLLIMVSTGGQEPINQMLAVYGGTPPLIFLSLFYGMFLSVGPLLEEMGWRGFALPILLERFDPLKASIFVGLMWGAWHLPREIPVLLSGDIEQIVARLAYQIRFFSGVIAGSILATFLYFKLGGSAWSGIIAHALHNETSVNFLGSYSPSFTLGPVEFPLLTILEILVAVVLLIITGRELGRPTNQEEAL